MLGEPHYNVKKRHFCPDCQHCHWPDARTPFGMCLKDPPRVFIIGMQQSSPIVKQENNEIAPVLRSYFPNVGRNDTCGEWTPEAKGEA